MFRGGAWEVVFSGGVSGGGEAFLEPGEGAMESFFAMSRVEIDLEQAASLMALLLWV